MSDQRSGQVDFRAPSVLTASTPAGCVSSVWGPGLARDQQPRRQPRLVQSRAGGASHVKGPQRPLGWPLAPGTALSLCLTVGGLVLGLLWRDGQAIDHVLGFLLERVKS